MPRPHPPSNDGRHRDLSVGAPSWARVDRPELDARLDAALERFRHLVVTGPFASGKTTAALALSDRAARRTRHVTVPATATPVPFGGLCSLLSGEEVIADVFQASAALRAALADTGVDLLVISDAHRLDEASALVIGEVARTGQVGLLLTLTSDEALPTPLTSLLADPEAGWIEVDRPDDHLLVAMAEQALGGPIEASAAHRLVEVSDGDLFRFKSVVQAALGSHILVEAEGAWRLVAPLTIDTQLAATLAAQLAALPADERRLVELISLAGSIHTDGLTRLAEPEMLTSLRRRGLVRAAPNDDDDEGIDRFSVPVALAEVAVADLTEPERRHRMLELLDLIRPDPPGSVDQARRAVWEVDAGLPPRAAWLDAAETAIGSGDLDTAVRLAQAVRLGDRSPERRTAAAMLEARGRINQAGIDAALTVYREAAEQTDEEWARVVALAAAIELEFSAGVRADHSIEQLDKLRAPLDPGPLRDYVDAVRATTTYRQGRLTEALHEAQALLESGRAARARARAVVINVLVHQGRYVEARELVVVGLADQAEEAERTDDELQAALLLHGGNTVLGPADLVLAVELDDPEEVWAGIQLARDYLTRQPVPMRRIFGHVAGAVTATLQDRLVEADADWREAVLDQIALGLHDFAHWCRVLRMTVWVDMDHPDCDRMVDELTDEVPRFPSVYDPLLDRVRAQRLHWRRADGALEAWRSAFEALAVEQVWVFALEVVADVLLAGHIDEATSLFTRLPDSEHHYHRLVADAIEAASDHDTARLGQLADLAIQQRRPIRAADLHALAGDLADDPVVADGHRRKAQSILRRVPGLRRPNWWAPPALSARELEVARLAAGGLTNREIADQLFLSAKTVENHLGRLYPRIGITGRREIAGALGRLGYLGEASATEGAGGLGDPASSVDSS